MSVHLFVRSCYSLLDSTVRIEELVHLAKAMGYHSLALTDHNVLYGLPAFEAACRKEGIKPIFGM
ncbi:PHP domain-containing protein [Galactobacillus timonensis]|nr:PHP domain-containing protein [Galactobacillus timonensis]MCI6753891.1 PHP domain-containing protein [Galactobacillus timonensis]